MKTFEVVKNLYFFQKIGLIGTAAPLCKKCNVDMKWKEKKDKIDEYAWKCPKYGCGLKESFNKNMQTFLKWFTIGL